MKKFLNVVVAGATIFALSNVFADTVQLSNESLLQQMAQDAKAGGETAGSNLANQLLSQIQSSGDKGQLTDVDPVKCNATKDLLSSIASAATSYADEGKYTNHSFMGTPGNDIMFGFGFTGTMLAAGIGGSNLCKNYTSAAYSAAYWVASATCYANTMLRDDNSTTMDACSSLNN